jgi:segregation and condensation protein A
VVQRTVSIAEKIEAIRALILDKAIVSFQSVMGSAKSRTDVIISFLAVLELVKQRTVMVTQNVLFHDISIKRLDTPPEA